VARQGRDLVAGAGTGGEALVEIILEHTHTCYQSERGPREAWGHGCGVCPACALRKRGYLAWREGRKVV